MGKKSGKNGKTLEKSGKNLEKSGKILKPFDLITLPELKQMSKVQKNNQNYKKTGGKSGKNKEKIRKN